MSKGAHAARRVSAIEVVQRCVAQGHAVYYARNALLPVIELEVTLREVSREQLGVLEEALLSLVHEGVSEAALLAELLGIAAPRLNAFIREFIERGMIEASPRGSLSLSETGRLSRRNGRETVNASRALLVSGLSGELLPASAYQAQRFSLSELARGARHRQLLVPPATVSLAGLDLSKITDKRAYNLPEEAQAVLSIEPHAEPCFVECFTILYRHSGRGPRKAEVWFPGAMLRDTSADLIEPYLEPFGFAHPRGERAALAELKSTFTRAGGEVSRAELDELGNPSLVLTQAPPSVLGWACHGRSLAYYAGADGHAALPISELQEPSAQGAQRYPADLDGHSLTLVVKDPRAQNAVTRARRLHEAVDASFGERMDGAQRRERMLAAVSLICSLDEALELASQLEDRRLLQQLRGPERG